MSVWILSTGRYNGESLEKMQSDPDYRRATRNMMMACSATKACLDSSKIPFEEISGKMGIVLATSHGELGSTVDFLKDLAVENTARPLYFQSSLHNATLGFLCKTFSLTGPGITVSDVYRSGEEALELAYVLLDKVLDYCLVVGVDTIAHKIQAPFQSMYPEGVLVGEGAGALLLSNDNGKKEYPSLAKLKEVTLLHGARPPGAERFSYDSYAIEAIAENIRNVEVISLLKPDETASRITWERCDNALS